MTNNNPPLLEMKNIQKDFYGNQVLTNISFTLRAGEVMGLVGENGAGKSTLMRILFGMTMIQETGGYGGDGLLNGEKVNFRTPHDALAAGIGMVHQEFSLIPGFTAAENILLNREPQKKTLAAQVFGPRLNTLDYAEMDRRADAAIEKMGFAIDPQPLRESAAMLDTPDDFRTFFAQLASGDDPLRAKRLQLTKLTNQYTDGPSAERVAAFLAERLREREHT